ncbi:MAG: LptF/LptG family permease [Treponema sp.]|jgi:lipopolysaccharide export system permease protein|nr:LptF/LptG family permease [Treponema sp.]
MIFELRGIFSPGRALRSLSRTIFWYIVRETLFSFLVAFLFFFFIFFVNQLLLMAQQILSKHVPFGQVALLIFYSLPSIIALTAPFACLVGTLMTVGRISSDNEILVMLSSGLSYANIFLPALAVGALISLLSFFTNDVLLPAGTVQFSRLYRRILVSTPALELEANSVKKFKNTVVVTGNVARNIIDDILILDKTSDGERRIIMAKKAVLLDTGREGLSLEMEGAFVQSSKEMARQDYDYALASSFRYWVPQEDIMQAVVAVSPREMSSTDVRREIRVKELGLRNNGNEQNYRILENALSLEEILRNGPAYEGWNRRGGQVSQFTKETEIAAAIRNDRSFLIYRLEYYKKFSIPFGALAFVFLAVPLGLLAKKSGQTVGFILGLLIAVLYWAFLFGGQTMGTRLGYSPFWAMWLPNVLALGIGFVISLVRIRH